MPLLILMFLISPSFQLRFVHRTLKTNYLGKSVDLSRDNMELLMGGSLSTSTDSSDTRVRSQVAPCSLDGKDDPQPSVVMEDVTTDHGDRDPGVTRACKTSQSSGEPNAPPSISEAGKRGRAGDSRPHRLVAEVGAKYANESDTILDNRFRRRVRGKASSNLSDRQNPSNTDTAEEKALPMKTCIAVRSEIRRNIDQRVKELKGKLSDFYRK